MKNKAYNVLASAVLLVLFLTTCASAAKHPDCTHLEGYPERMTHVYLKNAGIINLNTLDYTKTKIKRLASEKIGKDLYRQVHLIIFTKKTGEQIKTITISDASSEECSMSDVAVYVISKELGAYPGVVPIIKDGKVIFPKKTGK